jgi:hypothetical protein
MAILIRVPSLLSIRLVNKSILSEGFSYKLPIAFFYFHDLSFKNHQDLGSRSLINYKVLNLSKGPNNFILFLKVFQIGK